MGGVVRTIGWLWLAVGLLGFLSAFFAHRGILLPIPPDLVQMMALPWSSFATTLAMPHALTLSVTGVGVVINAAILIVIAGIIDR